MSRTRGSSRATTLPGCRASRRRRRSPCRRAPARAGRRATCTAAGRRTRPPPREAVNTSPVAGLRRLRRAPSRSRVGVTLDDGDAHRVVRDAVQVVDGAVDRVDDPREATGASGPAALLPEEPVVRARVGDPARMSCSTSRSACVTTSTMLDFVAATSTPSARRRAPALPPRGRCGRARSAGSSELMPFPARVTPARTTKSARRSGRLHGGE